MHHGGGRLEHRVDEQSSSRRRLLRTLAVFVVVLLVSLSSFSVLDALRGGYGHPEDALTAEPLDMNSMTLAVSPTRVYVDEQVTVFVNASSDDPAAMINVTIYFDYWLDSDHNINYHSYVFTDVSSSPANFVATYSYDHIGNLTSLLGGTYFQVYAFAGDGETITQLTTRVYVVENTVPWFESKPPATIDIVNGETYYMAFSVHDWDNELVTVTWDFGDGTEPAVNETLGTEDGSYVRQNHTWEVTPEPGRLEYDVYFNMVVSAVDAYGNEASSNHLVIVNVPASGEPDYAFIAQSNVWSPGYELPFYANVTDPEGDPITWTYVFSGSEGDYLTQVFHTEATEPGTLVWQNNTHTYDAVGSYSVTLFVSDALPPYQVYPHNLSQTIFISIQENTAPYALSNISVSWTDMTTSNPVINTTLGHVNVTFLMETNDFDGDVLNLTWDFGDGETALNRSLGGIQVYTFIQIHAYTVAGEYNVSVVIDDNRGHTVVRYKVIAVITTNFAPVLKQASVEMSHGTYAAPGTTVNLTLSLQDLDRDPLTVWVDFGDDTTVVMLQLSEFSENSTVSALLAHIYTGTGEYNITIMYTDGVFGLFHNKTTVILIEVKIPKVVIPRVWNWWDTTSLVLFIVAVSSVFVRWFVVGRFRKELDTKGMTLEEYRTIVSELKANRDEALAKIDAQVREKKLDPARAKTMRTEVKNAYETRRKGLKAKGKV